MHWIVMLVRLVMGLCFTQTLFVHGLDEYSLGFIPSYALDGFTLGLLFIYLFFQGKLMNDTSLHSRILFIHAYLPLVDHSGWMYKRMKDSHTTMYILENTSYIYIYLKIIYIWKSKLMQTFVHRYGTCSRASALGNKNTQIRPRIAQMWSTNVLSRGLLKHSNIK